MTQLEQSIHSYFGVTGNDISVIASFFKPEALKKGQYFSISDTLYDKLCFIESGFLRIYTLNKEKEVTYWIGSKGTLIGDIVNLTFKLPTRWNIQALGDT